MAVIYLDKNQIEEKTKSLNNEINEEVTTYVKEVNAFKEEVNKRITDMRSSYNVS